MKETIREKRLASLLEELHRLKQAAKWPNRFECLLKKGIDITAFCKKHKLNRYVLSRQINGHVTPSKAIFAKVQRGLKKEGV